MTEHSHDQDTTPPASPRGDEFPRIYFASEVRELGLEAAVVIAAIRDASSWPHPARSTVETLQAWTGIGQADIIVALDDLEKAGRVRPSAQSWELGR